MQCAGLGLATPCVTGAIFALANVPVVFPADKVPVAIAMTTKAA
jgi:hypothetical protein